MFKDEQITPIFCHPYCSFMSEMIKSASFFIDFTCIFQVVGLTQEDPIADVTKSCQNAQYFQ